MDERLVAVEQPVPPGQQVALQPPLAHVLAQHLHHPAVGRQVIVTRHDLALEGPVGHLEDIAQPVGGGLVRTEQPEVRRVVLDHVAQPVAEHPSRFRHARAGVFHRHGVVGEFGQPQVPQQQAAVGVRVGAHPPLTARGQRGEVRHQGPGGVEELLGPVRAQPLLQLRQVLGVAAHLGDRDLMRPPGPLHRQPVHHLGPGPPLGGAQDDGWPGGAGQVRVLPGPALDGADLGDGRVHGGRELLVDQLGVVALDRIRGVPVAAQQRVELLGGDPGQHRRVGDLVAVQVQDGQHRAVRWPG